MNSKTLGAGILALALPALLLSANAVGANAATVTSTVAAIDACAWQLSGAPTSVVLTSADSALYKGAALEVLDTDASTILGLAGGAGQASAISGDSTECSFYNDILSDGVDVAISGNEFVASWTNGSDETILDTDMDFALVTSDNELSIAVTETCGDEFTSTSAVFSASGTENLLGTSTISNLNAAAANVRCDFALAFSVDIPATSGVPAGAGFGYSFTGPTLTFAKSLG
jgi:hypothetical protein